MLYIDNKKENDFSTYKAELEQVFPAFFQGKPIIMKSAEELQFEQMVRRGTNKATARMVKKAPSDVSAKAVTHFVGDDGLSRTVAYTKVAPEENLKTGQLKFKKAEIILGNDKMFFNPNDLEQVIYLYFFSDLMKNGKRANPNASFYFEVPEKMAAMRIESRKAYNYLENQILLGGVSYKVVEQTMKALGFEIDPSEEVTRVRLFDFIAPSANKINEKAKSTFDNIVAATKGGVKASADNEVGETEDAKVVVDTVIENGLIKQDEEGNWKVVGAKGAAAHSFFSGTVEELYKAATFDSKLKSKLVQLNS